MPDVRERLVVLQSGLRRRHRLLEQLLAPAKPEQEVLERPAAVSLRELATDVINATIGFAHLRIAPSRFAFCEQKRPQAAKSSNVLWKN